MITGFYRVFSFRNRYIDPLVLASVPLLFFLTPSISVIVAIFFSIMGIWLICGKHSSSRYSDRCLNWLGLMIAIYAVAHLLIGLFSSGREEMICTPYQAYLALIGPFAVGLALVRDPLRFMTLSCRLGIVGVSLYSAYLLLTIGNQRMGFGTNPLIAGYVLLIFTCLARFPLHLREPRWFGLFPFYSGFLIGLVTSNRIVILFYALVISLDLGRASIAWIKKGKLDISSALFVIGVTAAGISTIFVFGERLRIDKALLFLTEGQIADSSLLTRVNLWKLGLESFYQQPLFGVGQCILPDLTSSYLRDVQNVNLSFNHLHNVFIHELAAHGIIGFVLVFSFHVLLFTHIYKHLNTSDRKWSLIVMFLGIFTYDLSGSHLSDDRMMAATVIVFGVLVAASGRVRHKRKLNCLR